MPAGEMGVTEKISVGGIDLRLRRRELGVVFRQLFEQSHNGEGVRVGIRVEQDYIIEVGGHVGRAFDEPSRHRTAPLWHYQPLEVARGSAECRVGYRVFVNRYLMERRD